MTFPATRFPKRHLALLLLGRGLVVWLPVRAILVGLSAIVEGSRPMLGVSQAAALAVVLLVAGLALLESRRANEPRFFANLGISPAAPVLLVALPALFGEILLGIITRL